MIRQILIKNEKKNEKPLTSFIALWSLSSRCCVEVVKVKRKEEKKRKENRKKKQIADCLPLWPLSSSSMLMLLLWLLCKLFDDE